MQTLRLLFLAALLTASGISSGEVKAQDKVKATDIKAAFVYNFAKFVEWPASVFAANDSTFRIGIAGTGPLNQAIRTTVESKLVANRRVRVVESGDARVLRGCHIVFFNSLPLAALDSLLTALSGHPVLTVGDQVDFVARGGMIGFFLKDDRVRFEIAPSKTRAEKLNVSSKLLRLAEIKEKFGEAE